MTRAGVTASCPDVAPVPDSGTDSVEFDAFELEGQLPIVRATRLRPKTNREGGALFAAERDRENDAVKPYPAPVVIICETVTALLREFVIASYKLF